MQKHPFIWETHGIHVGTGEDHVTHGIDDLDGIVEQAIGLGFPSLTFLIHSPRLTRFRYASERATRVKFIRGDASYFMFTETIARLRSRYGGRIDVRCGVELEWLGTGLGMQWSRAKLFQAHDADFVISSVHFAPNGLSYDGSPEDTAELIRQRGGVEPFWAAYFDEMIEMVDASWKITSVIGHIDLPKLYAPLPRCLGENDGADTETERRLSTLLEMIAERNLVLDVNLAGLRKGVGIYPHPEILRRAHALGIAVAIGTDTHDPADLGRDYAAGLEAVRNAGYRYYVSFSKGVPVKRPLSHGMEAQFRILNVGMEILNRRFSREKRLEIPRFSFGGGFRGLTKVFPESSSLGSFDAVRVRKEERSVTISGHLPGSETGETRYLFSHHRDLPGTLAILLNTLASEEINVETAWLNSLDDGTATAYLNLDGDPASIREAVEFVLGTAGDRFLRIDPEVNVKLPPVRKAAAYLLEVDGVWLPIPVSRHMLITVHGNRPGVLLILLSALASRNINVIDLQLGARGEKGFAALGIDGDERDVAELVTSLGPSYLEASQIVLGSVLP
ncbi:MAG TPA: histidinol-phosphatase HisJ family protein [Spirochaetia bacterium]|nr:histidinol-phosphatase HisJ family protein [Spirochaetia bacterium]